MNKVVNFFKKIKNWFAGNTNSFEDIMNNFLYGRYAKSSEQLVEIYKDRPSSIKNPCNWYIYTKSRHTSRHKRCGVSYKI